MGPLTVLIRSSFIVLAYFILVVGITLSDVRAQAVDPQPLVGKFAIQMPKVK